MARTKQTETHRRYFTAASIAEVPVLNDFLENKRNLELHTLTKTRTVLERQNELRAKLVACLKVKVEKMSARNAVLQQRERKLAIYLEQTYSRLALALADLPIRGAKHGATLDNIVVYMERLGKMARQRRPPRYLGKAKQIIRNLNLAPAPE